MCATFVMQVPSIHGLYVKNDNLQENDTLMCLHLGGVNFSNVTPEVFASIFRSTFVSLEHVCMCACVRVTDS